MEILVNEAADQSRPRAVRGAVFGITTGFESRPIEFTGFLSANYLDAEQMPPEVLIVQRSPYGWCYSFINYRFFGSQGRKNSHFGVAVFYDQLAPYAPKEIWSILQAFFDFLAKGRRLFSEAAVLEGAGPVRYEFDQSGFARVGEDWLREVLAQLEAHAATVSAAVRLDDMPAIDSATSATSFSIMDLDDAFDVGLPHLIAGAARVAFAPGLGTLEARRQQTQTDEIRRIQVDRDRIAAEATALLSDLTAERRKNSDLEREAAEVESILERLRSRVHREQKPTHASTATPEAKLSPSPSKSTFSEPSRSSARRRQGEGRWLRRLRGMVRHAGFSWIEWALLFAAAIALVALIVVLQIP